MAPTNAHTAVQPKLKERGFLPAFPPTLFSSTRVSLSSSFFLCPLFVLPLPSSQIRSAMALCAKLSFLLLLLLPDLLIPAVLCAEQHDGEVEEEGMSLDLDLVGQAIGLSSSELEEMVGFNGESEVGGELGSRRSLFWRALHYYYISYGALSANRVPCPPRSGRSYYTHNCYRARGPVRPYHRGCSAITRCSRSAY